MLVVIEGLDGAGKRTTADALTAELAARGVTVGRCAFPRYGTDVHADVVREALHGRHGDLARSVHGMAVLFALDRRGAADELRGAAATNGVLLVDRYVASNAAYGAARLGERADGDFVRWVHDLEIERFGLPVPDLQVLLRVPGELAAGRAERRARADAARARDRFESDLELQRRTGQIYDELAAASWLAPWLVLDGSGPPRPAALADQLLR